VTGRRARGTLAAPPTPEPAVTARLDPDRIRSRFPGLDTPWAFLDNAGGTQILDSAIERINEHLVHRMVQTGGSNAVSQAAAESLAGGRRAMARLVNASRPEEIAFAPTATVAAQNLARAMARQFAPGDEVVVSLADHESNIGPWVGLERLGVRVRFWAPRRETRALHPEDLDALLGERTRLVAVTMASNVLGALTPIPEIARRVHAAGARLVVDAVAAIAHRAIDVRALDCDYLFFSIYKVFGPHAAALWGRHELMLELDSLYHFFYGRDRVPMKLEPGNASYELAHGASAIPDYLAGLGRDLGAEGDDRACLEAAYDAIARHEGELAERLLGYLRERGDVDIVGGERGGDPERIATVAFRVAGRDAASITRALDDHHLAVRHGDFHARRLVEHLGLADASGVVRVSFAHYNTAAEADRLIAALDAVLAR
jgi:cysteine desulfurase family protein (TIGR01976 family)